MLSEQMAVPLRVVLIGWSFVGKKKVAEILRDKFGFKILKINEQQEEITKKNIINLLFTDYRGRAVFVLQKYDYETIKALKKRNFVNVILVQSSVLKRYQNYTAEKKLQDTPERLQKFIEQDDELHEQEYQKCLQFAKVRLFNKQDINFLQQQIDQKKEQILKEFRPSWNQYFMKIADIARRRSNCMKSSVGAVIANGENRVVSTGYNGTAKGLTSCYKQGCQRCNSNSNKSLDQCICLHAEESAIIEVGIGRTKGCSLYTTLYPCFSCAKVVKQAGIAKIYYLQEYDKEDSGKTFLEKNFPPQNIVKIKIDNIYY